MDDAAGVDFARLIGFVLLPYGATMMRSIIVIKHMSYFISLLRFDLPTRWKTKWCVSGWGSHL